MSTRTQSALPSAERFVRVAALTFIVGSVGQIVLGILEAANPSEPGDPGHSFQLTLVAVSFAMQLVGVIGLARSRAAGDGWLARLGLGLTIVGLGLFVVAVLAHLIAMNDILFPIAQPVSGLGMVLAGIAVLRTSLWRGWQRVTPLLSGLYPFLVLVPVFALAGGPNFLAIAGWNVCWLALGAALFTETSSHTVLA